MAELAYPQGVPSAMPTAGVGQKPYSNPHKRDSKKKDGDKTKNAQSKTQHLLPLKDEHGQKDSAPHGKGDLVDIVV
ncbi:hypothetical protein MJD09_18595 [bacterium]|nr:hypothetical protein [bacterium]